MNIKIEKQEIKFAAIGTAVILLWSLVIRNIITPYLESMPPILAMILYNIGIFGGLLLLSHTLNGKKFKIKFSIIAFMIILGINILTAPYLVEPSGTIRTDIEYWYVTSDAAFATMWGYFIPQAQLYLMTYIVTPILLIFLLPIILSDPRKIKAALVGA